MINVNYTNANSQYNRQSPNIKVDFSALNMQELTQSSGDVGKLIPVQWRELLPGQKVNIKQEVGVQFTPWVSNMLTPFEGRVMTYFVPSRLAWPDVWEQFITTGEGGIQFGDDGKPVVQQSLPTVNPEHLEIFTCYSGDRSINMWLSPNDVIVGDKKVSPVDIYNGVYNGMRTVPLTGSLWDYFGLPIGVFSRAQYNDVTVRQWSDLSPLFSPDVMPLDVLFRCYNLIWNKVLRFPDISPDERPLYMMTTQSWYWQNDYFTRSRIYQVRGEMPMIPISGIENITVDSSLRGSLTVPASYWEVGDHVHPVFSLDQIYMYPDSGITGTSLEVKNSNPGLGDVTSMQNFYVKTPPIQLPGHSYVDSEINLSDPRIGVSINDFLMALSIGRFEMNSAKIIPRYGDYLRDRWHTDPLDARLQLPEFVSTWTFGVKTNSVIQTSGATEEDVVAGKATPQGSITSIGSATPGTQNVSYTAPEHGYLITLMCIRPVATYDGGMSRFLRRKTPFDFATPELYNTPDVQNSVSELFWSPFVDDVKKTEKPFGWMGIYDEYRTTFGRVTGMLRPSVKGGLVSYSLARYWTSDSVPALNEEFCLCRPDMSRIKAYPDQPDFIFYFSNDYNTAIPIPFESDPAVFASL